MYLAFSIAKIAFVIIATITEIITLGLVIEHTIITIYAYNTKHKADFKTLRDSWILCILLIALLEVLFRFNSKAFHISNLRYGIMLACIVIISIIMSIIFIPSIKDGTISLDLLDKGNIDIKNSIEENNKYKIENKYDTSKLYEFYKKFNELNSVLNNKHFDGLCVSLKSLIDSVDKHVVEIQACNKLINYYLPEALTLMTSYISLASLRQYDDSKILDDINNALDEMSSIINEYTINGGQALLDNIDTSIKVLNQVHKMDSVIREEH